jgi:gamma-glutamyl hydrolase
MVLQRASFVGASLLAGLVGAASAGNPRPIVGILSMPNTAYAASHGFSFFPASYVKWLEAGGARVVPIPFDLAEPQLSALLAQINGALFTGGAAAFFEADGTTLTQYGAAGQRIFNESVAAHAAGETWPLWGTCLGHQFISVLAAGADGSVLTGGFDSENLTEAVAFAPAADASSLWGEGGQLNWAARTLAAEAVAINEHSFGITPADFARSEKLSSTMTVLATQTDRAGKAFTASQEGQGGLPVYSTQWHPEKSLFEWPDASQIVHNLTAVLSNHFPVAFFASKAAENSRSFADANAEYDALIYNFSPLYGVTSYFEQLYFFPKSA